MKTTRRVFAALICAILILSLQVSGMVFTVLAESAESEEQKIYSNAGIR